MLIDCFKSDQEHTVFKSHVQKKARAQDIVTKDWRNACEKHTLRGTMAGTNAMYSSHCFLSLGMQDDTSQPPLQIGWGPSD